MFLWYVLTKLNALVPTDIVTDWSETMVLKCCINQGEKNINIIACT